VDVDAARIPVEAPVLQHGHLSDQCIVSTSFYFLFWQKQSINVSKRAVHIALSIILVL